MPSLELLATIIAVIGNFILGIITFSRNSKSATNRFFAFFTTTLSLYLVFNFFSLHQTDVVSTSFWIKTVMSVAVFINLTFFLLATAYPGKDLTLKPRFLWVISIITILIALLAQTNLVFSHVAVTSEGIRPSPGPVMPLFLLHTIGLLGGGFVRLIKRYRKSEGLERRQLRMLFLGTILMFSFIIITNVILVLVFNISSFVNLLPVYTLILTSFVSYAIIQHSLFDLKILATQAFTVIIWVVLFSKIFVSQNLAESIMDSLIFVSMVIFGILLIKSVIREVEQREKLQELSEKLKALDKQKDEFLSVAAHELRSPLTAIKGYISMILEGDTGEIPDKARGYLLDSTSVTERLVRLINNMLDVSRIEEGRIVYQIEEVSLIKAVQEIYYSFKFEAERKGLEFNLNVPDGVQDKVSVDPDRVREVVGNLLSNAVKFTSEGSVSINVSQKGNFIRVEVVDTGPGITKEEQKKLFQKFYRAESTEGKTMGTGLGLYITRLLMEKFGGKISLDSEYGKGSTFWFELPLVGNDNKVESKD